MPNKATCKWYVSIEQPECGEPAVAKVRVKGKVTQAVVDLCIKHKSMHDENYARLRTERSRSRTAK